MAVLNTAAALLQLLRIHWRSHFIRTLWPRLWLPVLSLTSPPVCLKVFLTKNRLFKKDIFFVGCVPRPSKFSSPHLQCLHTADVPGGCFLRQTFSKSVCFQTADLRCLTRFDPADLMCTWSITLQRSCLHFCSAATSLFFFSASPHIFRCRALRRKHICLFCRCCSPGFEISFCLQTRLAEFFPPPPPPQRVLTFPSHSPVLAVTAPGGCLTPWALPCFSSLLAGIRE